MARNFFQKLLGIGNDEEDKKKQSSLYGGTASVRQAQQQKQAQAQADIKAGAPKQSFIERNITDRINANSDLDKFKRIQAGGKADFVADAELRGTRGFTNPLQGAGYGFARPGIKFTNTIAGATKDLGEGTGLLTRTALANLTNNQVARQNVEQDMRRFNARDLSYSGTGGILGTGANVQNKDDLNDPQKLAATILETGMQGGQYIGGVNAAFGKAGVLRSGATGLQRAAFNNPLLTDSLTQGGLNTLATGADQLKQGKFDAGQLAASFGTGAAFPVVTRGLSNVTREAIKPDGVLRDTTGSITVPSKARKYLEDTTQDPKLNPRLQRVPDAPLKPGTPLNQLDSAEVVSFVDSQRGTAKNLTKNQKLDLELNARAGAPRYGIDPELPPAKLADAYVKVLEESGYKPSVLKKVNYYAENTAKPPSISVPTSSLKADPLEALRQEARKYKSADEFADSLNAMKYGKVTGVGQLPVSKINKTQIKALTERGLPHTDTNLKVSDFKPGRQVTQPLEVYSKGGSWVVENGNHRLAQALANGDETVPVVFKGGEGKKYSTPITDLYNQATKPPKTKYLAEDTGLRDNIKSISNEELAKRYGGDLEPAQFKKSKFEQSVRGAEGISPELKKELKKSTPMYEAVTNKKQLAKSEELVKKDIGQATASVKERLTAKLGTVDNQTVSDTIAVIKRLDNKGTKKAFQESAELTEQLSLHLTKAGQTVQAASLLGKSTPDGILFRARKQLHQAGVEITPEIQAKLKSARDAIESKPMGSPERNYEIAKMLKITADNIPSTAADKLTTLWKAGLLTGIKTQTGNTLSGAASLGLKKVSDVPTAALDQIAALFTGKRSKALTLEGLGSGGKEGLVKGVRYLKTGIDERGMGFTKAKFDTKQVNFGNGPLGRAAQKYTDTVFGLMGAADQPLYFATLRNNLADLAIVEAKNQGLKGSVKDAFIKNFKKNPPEQAFQTATNAAEKATFANDTLLSKAAGGIRNSVKDSQVGSGVVNVLMPFTKVPSAVITRLFDYSPVGPVKLAVQQIQKGNVTQRALVEALGEATTGTGAMFLGYKLKEAGLMTGSYPEDPKEAALWELEGKKPNSIKVGNTWVSVNYTSPLGQVLGTGARAQEAVASGATGTDLISQTAAGAGKTVIDQSFLQGVSGGLDAITDPERSAGKFIRNQVGSVVPTLSGDVAKATDPKERQINSPLEAAQAKIPGLRKNLIPKVDALGNDINRPSGPINTILNPFRPSDIPNATELSSELRRLQDGGYGVLAKDSTKYLQVGTGKDALKVNLSPAELAKKNKEIGQSVQAQWNEIIASPEYKALSDEDKKRALDNAESDIKAVKKLEILKQKSPESIADMKLTKNQQKLAEGGLLTASAYAKPSEGAGSTDTSQYYKANDAEYNDKKSEYERKLKAGEYTKVGKIKAENELKRLQVGKDFSKDVRDLYGLNKTDLSALLESDPDGARYAEQVIAYDKKLYEAGLIKYRKFKNGIAPSTGKGGGRGGSKKSKNWLPTSTTSKFNASASSSASRKLLANTIVKNPRKKK